MIKQPEQIEGVIAIKDFLKYPHAVREHAMLSEFYDWQAPDGEVYKRITICRVPGLIESLEEVFGRVNMLGAGYRLNYAGEMPNQSIHSDVGWGTHAAVVYLCEGQGGTAFWQHKETEAVDIFPDEKALMGLVSKDFETPDAWELRHLETIEFNKAVIYESALFHSRYPFEAFGSSPKDGRLIAVAFFNIGTKNDT